MNSPNLYLLAGTQGLGHIMRSLTIESAWRSMFSDKTLRGEVLSESGIVVVDNYDIGDRECHGYMNHGHLVVRYTEFAKSIVGDIIVNQNLSAERWDLGGRKNLLGTRYFALREEYIGLRVDTSDGVFDADAEKRNLRPFEFSCKMASAGVVITAAGTTAYEAMYLGKTTLLRCIADNQELTYNNLIEQGYAFPATDENINKANGGRDFQTRRDGRFLVDGLGAGRVCREMMNMWRNQHGG